MSTINVFLKSILIFLSVLLVMVITQALFAFVGMIITKDPASSLQLLFERMSMVVVALILLIWAKERKKKLYISITRRLETSQDGFKVFVKAVVLTITILYLAFLISGLLSQYEFVHWGFEEYSLLLILNRLLLVGLLGNIVVAIGEEIIFRGFLLNYISNISSSNIFALLFTSLVFALHPYQDFLNYVIAFISGLILGYTYLKFKTLYIPIGIHFAYNFFNFTIASEPSRGPELPYLVKLDYQMIENGFGAWVDLFIIFGFLLLLLLIRKRFVFKQLQFRNVSLISSFSKDDN